MFPLETLCRSQWVLLHFSSLNTFCLGLKCVIFSWIRSDWLLLQSSSDLLCCEHSSRCCVVLGMLKLWSVPDIVWTIFAAAVQSAVAWVASAAACCALWQMCYHHTAGGQRYSGSKTTCQSQHTHSWKQRKCMCHSQTCRNQRLVPEESQLKLQTFTAAYHIKHDPASLTQSKSIGGFMRKLIAALTLLVLSGKIIFL